MCASGYDTVPDLHVATTAFTHRLFENRLTDTEFDVIKVWCDLDNKCVIDSSKDIRVTLLIVR